MQLLTPSAFLPIAVSAAQDFGEMWQRYRTTYNITWLEMFARGKPGVSAEALTADLTNAYRRSYDRQVAIQPRTTPIAIAQKIESKLKTEKSTTAFCSWFLKWVRW
jgi:hypothetical protein